MKCPRAGISPLSNSPRSSCRRCGWHGRSCCDRDRSLSSPPLGSFPACLALPNQQASAAQAIAATQLETAGIDHVGINVPDADAAIAFYRELLGATVLSDIRPAEAGPAWKERFRWHASARLERLVMLAIPGNGGLELFQYDTPEGTRDHPHQDDAGATHLALQARDIDRSIAVLKAHGLTILNDPITNPDGNRWFYFLTPWGSQTELVFPPAP